MQIEAVQALRHCKQGEEGAVADRLVVRGAREHNLKDVSLDLPRDAMIVFTGLSGSGKSSLAFDTISAGGQRGFVSSLPPYPGKSVAQMERPSVPFPGSPRRGAEIQKVAASRNP